MSEWIKKTILITAGDGVDMRFLFKCFCGRRMKNHNGDQEGWYCRKHGLQAVFKEVHRDGLQAVFKEV